MKRVIILFIMAICTLICSSSCWSYTLTGLRWDDSAIPVKYYIQENGSADISGGSEFTAILNSFATWSTGATDGAGDLGEYMGTVAGAYTDAAFDGFNILFWDENSDLPAGVVGQSSSWYYVGFTEILDNDIEFNGNEFSWSTDDGGAVGKYDVQSIATHEIGHLYGLDHSADPTATMYFSGSPGDVSLRTLIQDDIDGIKILNYPTISLTSRSIENFSATPIAVAGAAWNTLSWKNPTTLTFSQILILYRTDRFPASIVDGTVIIQRVATRGVTEYYNHADLTGGETYYYTAYAYDTVYGYSALTPNVQKSASVFGDGGKSSSSERSDCFVATACFGSGEAREVKVLRKFRDTRLKATITGRQFIRAYYLFGPYAAKVIKNNDLLKTTTRLLLVPIVEAVSRII